MGSSKTEEEKRVERHEWHALPIPAVLEALGATVDGLAQNEVTRRLQLYGKNEFTETKKDTVFTRIYDQFKSPLTIVLLLAFIATVALHDYIDASVIMIALLIAVILGIFQEGKASRAFEKLAHSQERRAMVLRAGKKHQIDAAELVPGDIVFIQNGMQVPADLRIIESKQLEINEATLTGEWRAVKKGVERVSVGTPLAETSSMAHMGTFVAKGYGTGVVTVTGDNTVVGSLAKDLDTIEDEQTPIQWEMSKISRVMLVIILVLVALIFTIGLLGGESLEFMLVTSIAVAVASIPEGLPAAVTIILAVGMESLLGRGGLVRNLLAAETLGSTTYILTDKTGTLTKARMEITDVAYDGCHTSAKQVCDWNDDEAAKQLFDIALCASDGYLDEDRDEKEAYVVRGEPIERAILEAAQDVGITLAGESMRGKRIDFLAFESENRFAAGLTQTGEGHVLCFNGAPELLLEKATAVMQPHGVTEMTKELCAYFESELQKHTSDGKRLIAVGYRNVSFGAIPEELDTLLDGLVFAGLLVFADPVREDVADAITGVMNAGAEVRLVTGDNPETALSIARTVGIARTHDVALTGDQLAELSDEELLKTLRSTRVFARVLPQQKLRLARVLQAKGEIVAMTGDGINDAPALRKANIGVALGSGTEVAKEASDLVLVNDTFSTIHAAIEEGRRIIDNLQKIVGYLLATSLSEVVLITAALITGGMVPLLPAQILWGNIIEEGLMSVAYAFEPANKKAMREKPQDIHEEGILSREMVTFLVFVLTVISALLLGLYAYLRSIDMPIEELRSIMFIAISADSLFIAFSFKSLKTPVWQIPMQNNLFFLFSFFMSLILLGIVITVPFLQNVFSYVPLSPLEFVLVFAYGTLSLIVTELGKWFFFQSQAKTNS